MLTATGLVNGRWRFSTPLQNRHPLPDRQKIVTGDYVGDPYSCAKFGWNRYSSFDSMHVSRFHEFGLKKPIHAPKFGVLGGFYSLNGEQYQRNPIKHILARVRVV